MLGKILSVLYAEFEIVAYVTQIHEVVRNQSFHRKGKEIEKNISLPECCSGEKDGVADRRIRDKGDSVAA